MAGNSEFILKMTGASAQKWHLPHANIRWIHLTSVARESSGQGKNGKGQIRGCYIRAPRKGNEG